MIPSNLLKIGCIILTILGFVSFVVPLLYHLYFWGTGRELPNPTMGFMLVFWGLIYTVIGIGVHLAIEDLNDE